MSIATGRTVDPSKEIKIEPGPPSPPGTSLEKALAEAAARQPVKPKE